MITVYFLAFSIDGDQSEVLKEERGNTAVTPMTIRRESAMSPFCDSARGGIFGELPPSLLAETNRRDSSCSGSGTLLTANGKVN